MKHQRKKRLSKSEYIDGVLSGNSIVLGRAITLIESTLEEDKKLSEEVLAAVLPYSGNALRIGITGVPGVGKSTFIEHFGQYLTGLDKKTAVLAIDPSSQRSKGSILGDKTRMETLSHDPLAFIRPSATGMTLGGVHNKTRETILLCEAAGYEVIIIETVGVGQSEVTVKGMVDFFLLLMLAGAGDELQGMKKGIMEMADVIAINKADGENKQAAMKAKAAYENALHLLVKNKSGWNTKVLTCSALQKEGLNEIWGLIKSYEEQMKANGYFYQNRQQQNLNWMQEIIKYSLEQHFYQDEAIKRSLPALEKEVLEGNTPALNAASALLSAYYGR